jgi:hypothetical protein
MVGHQKTSESSDSMSYMRLRLELVDGYRCLTVGNAYLEKIPLRKP